MDSNKALLSMDIDRYTRLGHEELQNGNLEQAVDAFIFAFKQARQLDDDYLERSCAFNLGAVYIASKKPEKGLEHLQRAVPPMNKRDGQSNGDLYYNFGLGYESLGNTSEMMKYFQMALSEYELEDNNEMVAQLAKKLGSKFAKAVNHKEAAGCYAKAAKAYANLFNVNERISMLNLRVQELLKAGEKLECVPALDECLLMCQKLNNSTRQVKLYGDLGLSYTQCGDYVNACKCFQEALSLVQKASPDKKKEAVILQNLGAVNNSLGQYEDALAHHEAAAALHAEVGNRGAQGQCFSNAAYSYTQLGDNECAGESYLHALQAAKDSGDKHGEWQALEGLGAVAFNNGQIDKAVQYFNRALVILSGTQHNLAAQERVVGKLTDAIQFKVAKGSHDLPPLPVMKRQSSKRSIKSVQDYNLGNKPQPRPASSKASVQSLPAQSPHATPKIEEERDIRRPRKSSNAGVDIPHKFALGIGEYVSDTDMSLSTAQSSRWESRGRRLSDEVDGMLKQFREDRKNRKNRPLSARPDRRNQAMTDSEIASMRARRRSRDMTDNGRRSGRGGLEAKRPSSRKQRRLIPRRPVSPSANHDILLRHRYDQPLLRTLTHDSEKDWKTRMSRIYKSKSDINWEYIDKIGPKISPRPGLQRGRSYNDEDIRLFSSRVSNSESTTITGSSEVSETETETETDETFEEHHNQVPRFSRDEFRYPGGAGGFKRTSKIEMNGNAPETKAQAPRPMSSKRPSDRGRVAPKRPSYTSSGAKPGHSRDSVPREPAAVKGRSESGSRSGERKPVSPRGQASPRKPEVMQDARERFEKRMMEHMEDVKLNAEYVESVESSSRGDVDSRDSKDPLYEDALPVAATPESIPTSVVSQEPYFSRENSRTDKPTTLESQESQPSALTSTEKSDDKTLAEYRRKLERRDASLSGTGSVSDSSESYTSTESETESESETVTPSRSETPPPVPPPLESTYEKPIVTEPPGPNFFEPDTDEIDTKNLTSAEKEALEEENLYESIRTGKFDSDPPKPAEEEPGRSGEGAGTSYSPPPKPPNLENMSRAEKEKALYEYQLKRTEYQRRREERRKLQRSQSGGGDEERRVRRSRMCIVM